MTSGGFSGEYPWSALRRSSVDGDRRWYVWQISLRSQPYLMELVNRIHDQMPSVAELYPVPLQWLRLHLCSVGNTDSVSFLSADKLVDSVRLKVNRIEPSDIKLSNLSMNDGVLTLTAQKPEVLYKIEAAIRASVKETEDILFDDYQSPDRFGVDIAFAGSGQAKERLTGFLTESDFSSATVGIRILGISHVLINPISFKTDTWTKLDVVGLHKSTYPG
jgi:hypothetical protein